MVRKLHFLMQLSSTHARYFFSELTGTSFMILQQNREKEEVCILVTASFSLPLFCTKLESRGRSGPSMSQVFEIAAQMKKKKPNIPHLNRELSSAALLLSELVCLTFTVCRWCTKCGWKLRWPHRIWGVRLQTANSLRLARCVTHTTAFPSRNISRFGGVGTAACRWKPLCLPVINQMFVKEVNPKYFWNVALLFHCLKRRNHSSCQRRLDLCCISTALNQDVLYCGEKALKSFRRESSANMAPPPPAPLHEGRKVIGQSCCFNWRLSAVAFYDRWQVRYRTSLS